MRKNSLSHHLPTILKKAHIEYGNYIVHLYQVVNQKEYLLGWSFICLGAPKNSRTTDKPPHPPSSLMEVQFDDKQENFGFYKAKIKAI